MGAVISKSAAWSKDTDILPFSNEMKLPEQSFSTKPLIKYWPAVAILSNSVPV